jgi:predicted SAM-dependent methyltransferase
MVSLHGRPFSSMRPHRAAAPPVRFPERLPGAKLNVGGGKGHPAVPGWSIVDLRERSADVVLDISREALPYGDESVAAIFCSHTREHIHRDRLSFVLSEFRRVLRPRSGLLRIAVPDIALAIRAYTERDEVFFRMSEVSQPEPNAPLGGLLASWFYSTRGDTRHGQGHVHCFDFEYLESWLRKAGFGQVWRSAYRQSALPELRDDAFDRHPSDSLFVEATR